MNIDRKIDEPKTPFVKYNPSMEDLGGKSYSPTLKDSSQMKISVMQRCEADTNSTFLRLLLLFGLVEVPDFFELSSPGTPGGGGRLSGSGNSQTSASPRSRR